AWPVWSDKNAPFFRLRRDTGSMPQIRSIDVSASGEFTFRNPRSMQLPDALMYQNYRDYDVTRNGDKFVILVPEQKSVRAKAPESRMDIVLNWVQELKQRVPVP